LEVEGERCVGCEFGVGIAVSSGLRCGVRWVVGDRVMSVTLGGVRG
jgi:hypothetical protein